MKKSELDRVMKKFPKYIFVDRNNVVFNSCDTIREKHLIEYGLVQREDIFKVYVAEDKSVTRGDW